MRIEGVRFHDDCSAVDWADLKQLLAEDRFDNGRSPEELLASFENSFARCFAEVDGRTIGKARALSDGVCNAYIIDVWTYHPYRHKGIATRLMQTLLGQLRGQHVLIAVTPGIQPFYAALGFQDEPNAMDMVVGGWLNRV